MKPEIVVLGPGRPSWIEMDVQLLGQIAPTIFIDVLDLGIRNLWRFISSIFKAKVCFFWFGSFRHIPFLILARLLGRRVIMVAGGYDVENIESISYGAFSQGLFSRTLRRMLFRSAHLVLAVSNYTRGRALANIKLSPERIRVASLSCAQLPEFELMPWSERPQQVALLISSNVDRFLCKGLDRVHQLAKLLPNLEFKLAGRLDEKSLEILESGRPPNLKILGFLKFQGPEFSDLLNTSRVILSTSRCESFGAGLVDGALYGCRPIAFGVGALPEVIGGIGEIVPHESVTEMALVLERAIAERSRDVNQTRRLAGDRFARSVRKRLLQEALESVGIH